MAMMMANKVPRARRAIFEICRRLHAYLFRETEVLVDFLSLSLSLSLLYNVFACVFALSNFGGFSPIRVEVVQLATKLQRPLCKCRKDESETLGGVE